METNNETVAAIVREMRVYAKKSKINGGEVDVWNWLAHFADRIEAAHKRELAELRECLREAVREKCPFTRMSCRYGEQCDYECGTQKWRKALEGSNNATK